MNEQDRLPLDEAVGRCNSTIKSLQSENDRLTKAYAKRNKACFDLKSIVAKLPRYEDTGEAFVPGVDEAWINIGGSCVLSVDHAEHKDMWRFCSMSWTKLKAYATRDAAEAAREQSDA